MGKEATNLKERMEGYMGSFGRKNEKGKIL